jgi:hypothetical protein
LFEKPYQATRIIDHQTWQKGWMESWRQSAGERGPGASAQAGPQGRFPGGGLYEYEFYRTFKGVLVPVLVRVFNAAFQNFFFQNVDAGAPLNPLLLGVFFFFFF